MMFEEQFCSIFKVDLLAQCSLASETIGLWALAVAACA